MGKYYTGIGSRETPGAILDIMQACAVKLGEQGWTLRSGGADGADNAFELGWLGWYANETPWPQEPRVEIYIPWYGFNKHDRDGLFGGVFGPQDIPDRLWKRAARIAEEIHPAWARLGQGAKKLHSRNVFQVLGKNLDTPSKFVLCYAKLDKRGEPKGGTRTAIKIAQEYGVEVINLYEDANIRRMEEWLSK